MDLAIVYSPEQTPEGVMAYNVPVLREFLSCLCPHTDTPVKILTDESSNSLDAEYRCIWIGL